MPQPQTLIVDTGSHYTAFPCQPCNNCGEGFHADSYFNPDASQSFHKLGCGHCTEDLNKSCAAHGDCNFSQSYAEGSSWSAFQARDLFYCGYNHAQDLVIDNGDRDRNRQLQIQHQRQLPTEYDLNKLNDKYSIPFIFGCQNSLTGLFKTQLADGIMGMSANEVTLPKQLYNNGKIEHNMFSMCFRRNVKQDKNGVTAGVLTLGGVDKRLERSPMVYAAARVRDTHGWYAVHVKKIWLRSGGGSTQSAKGGIEATYDLISDDAKTLNSGDGIIVDSGTTDTYLRSSLGSAFKDAWKDMTGMAYSNHKMKLTREQVLQMPTILIQMTSRDYTGDSSSDQAIDMDDVPVGLAGHLSKDSPGDILLAIPATHYMEYTIEDDAYTPRVYFTERSGGVLGANAMLNHDVLFDWENERVGFAESNCDYDELMQGVEIVDEEDTDGDGDGASSDCVLGEGSMDMACVETVNFGKCVKGVDPDTALIGIIKWSMVVEAQGFDNGKTCESVAESRYENEKSTSIRTLCDADGVCSVILGCSMTCKEVEDEVNAVANADVTIVAAQDGTCPNDGWGACQYSCEQSKITSEMRHDGQCHMSHLDTRPCHIDNCGRSDPCRVPFVVHAIVLFANTDSSLWTKKDEELFVESFAKTVNMDRQPEDELFGPGDVKVLSVGPWKANDDSFYEGNVETGMQLVLEVSIYNDNAILLVDDQANKNGTLGGVVQKGKDVMHIITGPDLAKCKESDIYPLSQTALDVHLEMGKDDFMRLLIQCIREMGYDSLNDSVFESISDEGDSVDKSTVLTSWTVKTEVGGLFQDGTFQGINQDTLKSNVPLTIAIFLFLFCICYCGVCCGTFCTRRRFKLMERIRENRREKRQAQERGNYSQVGVDQGDAAADGGLELGNAEDFQDNPIEEVVDLDFGNASEKMSRLK